MSTFTRIEWDTFSVGEHRTNCPMCGKPKAGDKTLGVTVYDDDNGVAHCFRCEFVETHHRGKPKAEMTAAERAAFAIKTAQLKAAREAQYRQQWARNLPRIRATWEQAHRLVMGDPVTLYLKSRNLGGIWPLPACLRFHPCLPYWEDGEVIGSYPAMLAMFRSVEGRFVALHQTYLTRSGKKADVYNPKKMSPTAGWLAGGCIPLSEPRDGVLGVAEGIETALCASAASGLPVVAAYSASCLAAYVWPKTVRRLVIFGDNDESETGQQAARKLARRARMSGLEVSVHIPQMPGEDWADVWAQKDQANIDAVAESLLRARVEDQEGGEQ